MPITGLERNRTKRFPDKIRKNVFVWAGERGMICRKCRVIFQPTLEQVETTLKKKEGLVQFDCPGCKREALSFHITKQKYLHWGGEFVEMTTTIPAEFLPR